MEWARGNEFNSFNSWKGLLYADWYEGVRDGKFLPPVEASLDPIHACNLNCAHCNARRYLKQAGAGNVVKMDREHLLSLVRFLGDWGVKAVCFGGGGEPTLHPGLHDAVVETRLKGMEASIATNGTLLHGKLLDVVPLCRWVGVSVDAATDKTYARLKGVELFRTVVGNLVRAVKKAGKCDVAYKFLISSINQGEILEACKLAKDIGVRDFHARPMDFHHQGLGEGLDKELGNVDMNLVMDQFQACHELETDEFRVFTVMHKFNPDLTPRRDFTQCYAAPLSIQLCADGWVYFCVDQRHRKEYRLGTHYPDPSNILNFWSGERHVKMVKELGLPGKCGTRCTFGVYNRQCEQLFIQDTDPMCWRFV